MPMDDDLITPREAARMLGVRVTTISRWARDGALKPTAFTPGGQRRYHRDAVSAILDATADPKRLQIEYDAVRLYEQGWSIRQVAARFDCGYSTMRRILLRHTTLRDAHRKGEPS